MDDNFQLWVCGEGQSPSTLTGLIYNPGEMFGGSYRMKPPSRGEGTGRAVMDWLRSSQVGWKWFAVVLPFQVISAATNVAGLRLALELPFAILMGIGLQMVALYIGLGLINASEESRGAWKRALAPIIVISVFFSFAGFTSFYAESLDARTRPLREREDLRKQATDMATAIDEGRRVAVSAYQNRIDYAQNLQSQVNTKLQEGGYDNPLAAQKAIAAQNNKIQSAEKAKEDWNTFSFDAASALTQPTVEDGFKLMQGSYARFGQLMGSLRKNEAEGFQMPQPPLPTIQATEGAAEKDLVSHALSNIVTWTGFFWLLIAFFLEAIPFWIAHANPPSDSVEEDGAERDRALEKEIARFNAKLRPLHFLGADSMADVEEQAAHVDRVVREHRKSHIEALRLERMEKDRSIRRRQLEMLVEEARIRGVPEDEIARIVQEDWIEVMKDFGIETIRLERQREGRHEEAINPEASPEAA
ncbi:hypothetical protein EON81_19140 [bacterium]|nr:MAG: hypothetical protein EON81_19140 [bacterium]